MPFIKVTKRLLIPVKGKPYDKVVEETSLINTDYIKDFFEFTSTTTVIRTSGNNLIVVAESVNQIERAIASAQSADYASIVEANQMWAGNHNKRRK